MTARVSTDSLYLTSSARSNEKIAAADRIAEGLVRILRCVDPRQVFAIHRDAEAKIVRLVPGRRKCLSYDFSYLDRGFGLIHVLCRGRGEDRREYAIPSRPTSLRLLPVQRETLRLGLAIPLLK